MLVLKGVGVSPGVVVGKAYILDRRDVQMPRIKLRNSKLVPGEIKRFEDAIKKSEKELADISGKLGNRNKMGLLFVDIHLMILKDKRLTESVVNNIKDQMINAEWALDNILSKYRESFEKMEDDYLKGRIKDIEDVAQRVLRNLSGGSHKDISDIKKQVIVIARDLSPADTVQIKTDRILAFATDMGGKTSHTAIVARSIEIPAVVGLERVTGEVKTGDVIIVDGTSGVVIINPDPEALKRYEDKRKYYLVMEEGLLRDASLPAVTKDNHSVGVGANIEFIEEIPSAVAHGANGVGLYRTEFMYINREKLPGEEEHFSNYKKLVEAAGIKWATIRTFDLGGDKFISNPKIAKEMNPAMGLRAVRFCLQEIELFKIQLRAILRASAYGNTGVIIPMISGVEEIREVKKIIEEVKNDLLKKNIPINRNIKKGVMIEVPSAVVMADSLAKEVDFFSIGTNDLIQYALAIDRINERVTYLYRPLHPAVLRLLRRIVYAGHSAGIKVAMCGEMAGDPFYTMILLGLELDGLSMTPLAIPRVKRIIRQSTLEESKKLLEKAMSFSTASEIESYVTNYMTKRFPEYCQANYRQ
jgi:phosphotransferase system enzyme I (PtsI)